MRINEKKVLFLEFITFIVLILDIFLKNITTDYKVITLILILFLISIVLVGFDKSKTLYEDKIIKRVIFYTISFLILIYGIGLLSGFLNTSYSLTLKGIIKNIIPVIIIIIIEELYRYNICKKCNNNLLIISIAVILFTMFDTLFLGPNYNLNGLSNILKLLILSIFPNFFKNLMLIDISRKYGFKSCIAYRLIIELYVYIIPIVPNLGEYVSSIVMCLLPICILVLINMQFKESKKEDIRDKNIISKIISTILIIIILNIVALFSNFFPLWIAIIGSGSMTPTINVGDAIIIDKISKDEMPNLKVGDILVFKVKKSMYTHRIIDIKIKNDEYYIKTKGDRKGNTVDDWTITSKDVIGIVKFKIPYIGYPTVWLNKLLKE